MCIKYCGNCFGSTFTCLWGLHKYRLCKLFLETAIKAIYWLKKQN